MDVANPIRSLSPTVDADVLLVLVRTHAWLTGARVARLAGRSYAQVRVVLQRLVDAGLVDMERHGNAFSYRSNREHVLCAAVEALAGGADAAERRMADEVGRWDPPPYALVVFGSFARRDGGAASDLDMLLVRPDGVDEEDGRWRQQRYALVRDAERWTGNRTQVLELSVTELEGAVEAGDQLVASLLADGKVLAGPPLHALLGPDEPSR